MTGAILCLLDSAKVVGILLEIGMLEGEGAPIRADRHGQAAQSGLAGNRQRVWHDRLTEGDHQRFGEGDFEAAICRAGGDNVRREIVHIHGHARTRRFGLAGVIGRGPGG